MLQLHKN